jgi:signal transduction histidine kinase/ActR/RegA family two-component response regulator
LAVVHGDPSKLERANEMHRRYPPQPDAHFGPPHVLRTGRPEIAEEITDSMLTASNPEGEYLRFLRDIGLRSYICVPLAARGKVLGTLTFLTTTQSGRRYTPADLELAEDLAHRAAVAIDNALLYDELRETDRKKDEFLAILAHELRNPLAPLSNALQILRLTAINTQAAEVRDLMERQVRQMTRLVDDLLDVSRITRGKIELRRERLDLAEVVLTALETSRPAIEAGQHELTVTPAPQPLFVMGDRTRLAQMLSNLLTNAAKYTPERGRIWLSVEASGVASAPASGVASAPREARIRVRDNGVGIPADMLPKIFDMFTQVERHTSRSQGGLGIGLTLVRSLVQMHGGRVEAHSGGPGTGSEFVVHLPLAVEEPKPADTAKLAADAGGPSVGRRILVVDDNVDSAESLALMLRLSGNDVRTAHDGPSALRAAEEFVPEVVLLDIGMPGMDGHEVARRLRRMPPLRNALLIAQTGWGQDEDLRRSEEAGFDRHFTKPVDPVELKALLAAHDRPSAAHPSEPDA